MGLANATASLRTASVRQDQRKYLAIRIVPAIVRIPLLISAITTKSTAVPVPCMTALYLLFRGYINERMFVNLYATLNRASQKSLNPLTGIAIIVRAGAVEWGGGDPCGRPSSPLLAVTSARLLSSPCQLSPSTPNRAPPAYPRGSPAHILRAWRADRCTLLSVVG